MTRAPDIQSLFAPVADMPRLGLAVSGGADSLALMLLAERWAKDRPVELIVYSLDHGLRPEAAEEVQFVARTARALGLRARTLRWAGPHPETGVQARARQARYRLIGEAMAADGVPLLLTAHHAQDQAETVLMRLAHGSGLAGLAGMKAFSEVEGVRVFRPLLGVDREALRAVVAAAGLVPVSDPSNEDPDYERVRWRNLLPHLHDLGLTAEGLARFARRAGEADAALDAAAKAFLDQHGRVSVLGSFSLPASQTLELATAVGVRVLGAAVEAVRGQAPELAVAERAWGSLFRGRRQSLEGVLIAVRGDRLFVVREPGRQAVDIVHVAPGMQSVWDERFAIGNGLAGPIAIRPARDWNRAKAEAFLGEPFGDPIGAVHSAPLICDAKGNVLALGFHAITPSVRVVPVRHADNGLEAMAPSRAGRGAR